MALGVVVVMILTGFVVLGFAAMKSGPAPDSGEQPEMAKPLAGSRELTYTMDHMFELYMKSHTSADLGRWNGTMGLNEWWPLRQTNYQEYQSRTAYPFALVYNLTLPRPPLTSTWVTRSRPGTG